MVDTLYNLISYSCDSLINYTAGAIVTSYDAVINEVLTFYLGPINKLSKSERARIMITTF